MCANADKTVHLKTLIAEIKVLYAQWKKARKLVKPTALPSRQFVDSSSPSATLVVLRHTFMG
jgi:hypothetical protein